MIILNNHRIKRPSWVSFTKILPTTCMCTDSQALSLISARFFGPTVPIKIKKKLYAFLMNSVSLRKLLWMFYYCTKRQKVVLEAIVKKTELVLNTVRMHYLNKIITIRWFNLNWSNKPIWCLVQIKTFLVLNFLYRIITFRPREELWWNWARTHIKNLSQNFFE